MRSRQAARRLAALTAVCAALTACGGGGEAGPDSAMTGAPAAPAATPEASAGPVPKPAPTPEAAPATPTAATPEPEPAEQQPPGPAPAPVTVPAPPTPPAGVAACGDMTQLLAAINEFRSQPRACASGPQPAAAALQWSSALAEAASRHAYDMARGDFFSHIGSDGSSARERVAAVGYGWFAVAENIGAGYASAADVVNGWTSSRSGHCEALMNPAFTEIGGACGYGAGTEYGRYWTIDLVGKR